MSELEWLDRVEQLSATRKDRCNLVSPTTNRLGLSRMIFESVWQFNEWDLKILRECLKDRRYWMLFEAHYRLKIEGFHRGDLLCPNKFVVRTYKCNKVSKVLRSDVANDIRKVQDFVWQSLVMDTELWIMLTKAKFAFDTVVQWSLGDRLITEEGLATLRQFLKNLPSGDVQILPSNYGESIPTWLKTKNFVDKNLDNLITYEDDWNSIAVNFARWAGTSVDVALQDYINPEAITECRTELEVRSDRIWNELQARKAIYTVANQTADAEWLTHQIDGLPFPTGSIGEPSVLNTLDKQHPTLGGNSWKKIAREHGWKEVSSNEPTCEEIRLNPEKWLNELSERRRKEREGIYIAIEESTQQASLADGMENENEVAKLNGNKMIDSDVEMAQSKDSVKQLYGIVRPPVPYEEDLREGDGWGAQDETFRLLHLAMPAIPSMQKYGNCERIY